MSAEGAMEYHTRFISQSALLVAVCVAVGLLLVNVPNVEGMSAVAFTSGYLLGAVGGGTVGGIAMLLFSLFNPLGPPVPAVLLAQVLSMALVGACGRLWKSIDVSRALSILVAGLFGGVLTAVYSLATDFAFALAIGKSDNPLPVIVAGLPFSLVHIFSNVAIFSGLGVVLTRRR